MKWKDFKERICAKEGKYFSFLVDKISTIIPNLEENIDHKEIGTPKLIKSFLEDMKVVMDRFLVKNCLGFCLCLLILQKLKTFIA